MSDCGRRSGFCQSDSCQQARRRNERDVQRTSSDPLFGRLLRRPVRLWFGSGCAGFSSSLPESGPVKKLPGAIHTKTIPSGTPGRRCLVTPADAASLDPSVATVTIAHKTPAVVATTPAKVALPTSQPGQARSVFRARHRIHESTIAFRALRIRFFLMGLDLPAHDRLSSCAMLSSGGRAAPASWRKRAGCRDERAWRPHERLIERRASMGSIGRMILGATIPWTSLGVTSTDLSTQAALTHPAANPVRFVTPPVRFVPCRYVGPVRQR